MRDKLRQHFLNIGPRRFVWATISVLIITDLLNSWYMKLYWENKNIAKIFIERSIRQSGYVLEDFSRDTMVEMSGFLTNTFHFFLILILANNLFFYFWYSRKKLWAQGYVLFYVLTGSLLSFSFMIDNAGLGPIWMAYNVATVFIYGYLFFGIKLLKPETTVEKKKAR